MSSYAGTFLVARTSLTDPNFSQSVVLLLAHNDEGAYGVVVNRPLQVEEMPFPVFLGGPCESPGLILLHGHPEWNDESDHAREDKPGQGIVVGEGIFVGDAQCLKRASEAEDSESVRIRVFRNYSGWGPGQLEAELASGAWTMTRAHADVLFETDAEDIWFRLAPSSIPDPSLN